MKSMFWPTCVILITAVSCNSPKKVETVPGTNVVNTKAGEPNLVQAIAGTYMMKTGTFQGLAMTNTIKDLTLKLCPNGKFLMRYASPEERGIAEKNSTLRGADDNTETTLVRGTWHIEGTPAKGKITLDFRRGNTKIYIYEVKQKGWLNFNRTDFWRMGSAHCR
ncbi:MAG: hypothetical protein DRJ14_06435 [Acidobacteria bacterium]|nr:MAG: hypothetical protein DRJ14_06435 [Acidobacteriota bacterium]